MRRLAAIFALACTTLAWPASAFSAPVSSECNEDQLGDAYATANLTLDGSYADDIKWSSLVEISVPDSWPLARDLLEDSASSKFERARSCLENSRTAAREVTLSDHRIVLTLRDEESI